MASNETGKYLEGAHTSKYAVRLAKRRKLDMINPPPMPCINPTMCMPMEQPVRKKYWSQLRPGELKHLAERGMH